MKTFFTLLAVLFSTITAVAQSITIRFTAQYSDGSYCRLDSVKVQNHTQVWGQTLSYPDTILVLNYEDGVSETNEARLKQHGPNPFHKSTDVRLTLTEATPTRIQLINLNGSIIAEKNAILTADEHSIKVSLAKAQMAILRITTPQNSQIIKLLCIEGSYDQIDIFSVTENKSAPTKEVGNGFFSLGDMMSYIGIILQNGSPITGSNIIMQAQYNDETITFLFEKPAIDSIPEGAINGLFTINANGDKVYFSKGNLQYQATTDTWRFAEHQWDTIGIDNMNISSSYSSWIDLFGWGTGNHPTNISTNDDDYSTFNDWGEKPVTNGGGQPNQWRTLSDNDWYYITTTRNTSSGIRYAKAMVNEIPGLILLPDDWNNDYYTLNNINTTNAAFTTNNINLNDWNKSFEDNGAVFLPAAGFRYGNTVNYTGSIGHYWTSRPSTSHYAFTLSFDNQYLYTNDTHRYNGFSIRLAKDL